MPGRLSARHSDRRARRTEGPEWSQAVKMPPIRAVCAGGRHDHWAYFFLPWVLPGILMTCVFAAQGWWARAPGGRRWSLLATAERPRTAQGRPGCTVLPRRSQWVTDDVYSELDTGMFMRQPTTASHHGGCADRSGARVPRCTPASLSHAAMSSTRASRNNRSVTTVPELSAWEAASIWGRSRR